MKRSADWFVRCVGLFFAFTGLAKILSVVIGEAKLLDYPDPVLGIPFRDLLALAAIIELVIALMCALERTRRLALLAIAWLATVIASYRMGVAWLGWHTPCSCLGDLMEVLHISQEVGDWLMISVLAVLLVFSYSFIVMDYRESRSAEAKNRNC